MIHIVLDLEMNPIKRSEREKYKPMTEEVIEIGAVKLDDHFEQVDSFQCYIKPQYAQITKHITELTGITNETVNDKNGYVEEFDKFLNWISEKEDVTLYSWSTSDMTQLQNECRYKIPDFNVDWLEQHWIDLQKAFDDKIGLHSSLALKHAVGAMNRNFEGTAHTALADAENTAAILVLMQDNEKFLTTMQPVIDMLKPKSLTNSIGDMFPELMNLKL